MAMAEVYSKYDFSLLTTEGGATVYMVKISIS